MHLTSSSSEIHLLVREFFLSPLNHPEIMPTVLPLIIGAVGIELYFGKHPDEKLGWNSSVGNAIIWTATGFSLLITGQPTGAERKAVYSLILLGGFVGYMNFNHRWPASVAYLVSSAGIVYSLAYILVVIVRTDMAVNGTTLKAAAVFLVAVNMGFKLLQGFETPERDSAGFPRK